MSLHPAWNSKTGSCSRQTLRQSSCFKNPAKPPARISWRHSCTISSKRRARCDSCPTSPARPTSEPIARPSAFTMRIANSSRKSPVRHRTVLSSRPHRHYSKCQRLWAPRRSMRASNPLTKVLSRCFKSHLRAKKLESSVLWPKHAKSWDKKWKHAKIKPQRPRPFTMPR